MDKDIVMVWYQLILNFKSKLHEKIEFTCTFLSMTFDRQNLFYFYCTLID